MGDIATLRINSVNYKGWKGFSISKSIETIANAFTLSVTDNWNGEIWPIKPGDLCEVFLSDELLITGYVDEVHTSVSKDDRTIEVTGRDKTSDLVDCSIDGIGPQFSGLKFEKLCEKLCAAFGIVVENLADTGAVIPMVRASVGETCFEILEKRARQKGLLLTSSPDGKLRISEPGKTYAVSGLEQGENILSCSSNFSQKDRFSSYKIKAQNGFDENGTGGFQTIGRATDPNIPRYRPLVISAENAMTNSEAKKRAEYEAITRAARAVKVSVTVPGFRQRDNSFWKENQIIKTNAPSIGVVNEELLISDITYACDENGSTTAFGLKRKDAFIAVPEVSKKDELSIGIDSE